MARKVYGNTSKVGNTTPTKRSVSKKVSDNIKKQKKSEEPKKKFNGIVPTLGLDSGLYALDTLILE